MKRIIVLGIGLLGLASCTSIPVEKYNQDIRYVEVQRDSNAEKLLIQKQEYEEKIADLSSQISSLEAKLESLKQDLANSQAMLEPYKGLSEAEAKLKQAQLEKTEIEARIASAALEKKELADQKAAEEAAAKAEAELQKKAAQELAAKERSEDAKYAKIGLRPVYVNCEWSMVNDFGNQLFSPKLNLKLKNVSSRPISKSEVRVVFLDIDNKEVFDEQKSYFVSEYSDSPLDVGFSKEIIVTAGKGYSSQWANTPNLRADIYIDKQLLTSLPVVKN